MGSYEPISEGLGMGTHTTGQAEVRRLRRSREWDERKEGVKKRRSRSDSEGNKTESLGQKVGREGESKGDDQIRLRSHDAGFGCACRWSKTTHGWI